MLALLRRLEDKRRIYRERMMVKSAVRGGSFFVAGGFALLVGTLLVAGAPAGAAGLTAVSASLMAVAGFMLVTIILAPLAVILF